MNLEINQYGLLKDPKQGKYADYNLVFSFKGRTIDKTKPILVYRNTNKKTGKWFSIKQNNIVVAHALAICIRECKFLVNEKARQRILKSKNKESHAYIKGFYSTSVLGSTADLNDLPAKIEYNPLKMDGFYVTNLTIKPKKLKGAEFIICNKNGVRGAYTYE